MWFAFVSHHQQLLLRDFIIFHVYECLDCMYACTMGLPCVWGDPKRASKHLKPELQMGVNYHVGGSWELNQDLLREQQAFSTNEPSLQPTPWFLIVTMLMWVNCCNSNLHFLYEE